MLSTLYVKAHLILTKPLGGGERTHTHIESYSDKVTFTMSWMNVHLVWSWFPAIRAQACSNCVAFQPFLCQEGATPLNRVFQSLSASLYLYILQLNIITSFVTRSWMVVGGVFFGWFGCFFVCVFLFCSVFCFFV